MIHPPTQKRILLIEDDPHIAEGLKLNLTLKGYEVTLAPDGPSGLQEWKVLRPDLIVLDIMLPGIDGFSVLRNIRLDDERIPILILSARGEPEDRVKGLAYGVDDYLTKPFHLKEFLLRVERLLIRDSWQRNGQVPEKKLPDQVSFGGNMIDFTTATAHCANGRQIRLTEQELKLLKLFLTHPGIPLTRSKLLEIGWSYTGRMNTRTVDNFIVRFRKYFEKDPKNPVHFQSLRAIGYVFIGDL